MTGIIIHSTKRGICEKNIHHLSGGVFHCNTMNWSNNYAFKMCSPSSIQNVFIKCGDKSQSRNLFSTFTSASSRCHMYVHVIHGEHTPTWVNVFSSSLIPYSLLKVQKVHEISIMHRCFAYASAILLDWRKSVFSSSLNRFCYIFVQELRSKRRHKAEKWFVLHS